LRVAIVGSRNYPALEEVREFVRSLLKDSEVVSGGARGVDSVAVSEALKLGLKIKVFEPDWGLGRGAGMIRNGEIAKYADRVVAFHFRNSRGTADTIRRFWKRKKPVEVREPKK